MKMVNLLRGERLVICIGDIHGHYSKLQNLWCNIKLQTNPSEFNNALIIFLGDYCDKGPDTKNVIDFLVSLPSKYPNQKHVFLSGNHDFAFAAFLELLRPPLDGAVFEEGWQELAKNEYREGWYSGEGYENMHVQGRRWGGTIKDEYVFRDTKFKGSVYKASPTFKSYGVPHGSPDLMNVVPDNHKKFLADLVWVHEEDNVVVHTAEGTKNCRLIAVHSGIIPNKPVDEQLKFLKAKDTPTGIVENLYWKRGVCEMPEELRETETILVSGHHGKLHIDGLRLIIDEGGGHEHKPVAAIILPSMKVVRDTDCVDG